MAGILIYICGSNIHKTDFKPNRVFIKSSMRHNARVKHIEGGLKARSPSPRLAFNCWNSGLPSPPSLLICWNTISK